MKLPVSSSYVTSKRAWTNYKEITLDIAEYLYQTGPYPGRIHIWLGFLIPELQYIFIYFCVVLMFTNGSLLQNIFKVEPLSSNI